MNIFDRISALASSTKLYLYYAVILFIICFSFIFYAPCNYSQFNSDHAIHVLMAKNFELPRDFYYWGQDRLGSLLPMIASMLGKILPIHYLYLCSLVAYGFLFTGFYLMSSNLRSYYMKIALCAILFLPVNLYSMLILIGHPYSSQLFLGCLLVLCLTKLKNQLIKTESFHLMVFAKLLLCATSSIFFYILGVWVSEFSAILFLVPMLYVLMDKKLRFSLLNKNRIKGIGILAVVNASLLYGAFSFYQYAKSTATVADGAYGKMFLDTAEDILKNWGFFFDRLINSLSFNNNVPLENFFNWFIILLTVIIIIRKLKGVSPFNKPDAILFNTLIIISLLSCIILFFSRWVLRSSFSPQYFTPVYIMYCFALLLYFDDQIRKLKLKFILSFCFVFFGFGYCYSSIIIKSDESPFNAYGDFAKLPEGTLIGDYWDVYKINAVALDNLKSIPFEYHTVRNWDWREELLSANTFYFLNNQNVLQGGLRDTIYQFGLQLKYTGTKYDCNNYEVLAYSKLQPNCIKKFLLKASNGMYVSLAKSDSTLSANETDSAKAEIFELLLTRQGSALKSSNGKFIYADYSDVPILTAKSDNVSYWELFHIISAGRKKINFQTYSGQFVSADQRSNNVLIANREKGLEWETFELILK